MTYHFHYCWKRGTVNISISRRSKFRTVKIGIQKSLDLFSPKLCACEFIHWTDALRATLVQNPVKLNFGHFWAPTPLLPLKMDDFCLIWHLYVVRQISTSILISLVWNSFKTFTLVHRFQKYASCLDTMKNVDVVSVRTYSQNHS